MGKTGQDDAKRILDVLETLWFNGIPCSEEIPGDTDEQRRLARLLREIEHIQDFCRSLANGDLSSSLVIKGTTGGELKALQASLRHITWQTKMISEGDFTQRIDFMGEFTEAFNAMAGKLNDAQSMVKLRERELVDANSRLRTEVKMRRFIEEKLSLSNKKLQQKLKDIENLQKRLKEELIRDSLTGLFNRRYLMETIDREFALSVRDGRPLSILLVDIDFFKQVNDNFGHQTGDFVLKALAGLLQQYSRTGDMACRIGGEEFVLILPSASLDKGLARAEEFRQRVQEARFRCNGSRPKITISIGVASVPSHGIDAENVMAAADKALYSAKNAGRNRVSVAEKTQVA